MNTDQELLDRVNHLADALQNYESLGAYFSPVMNDRASLECDARATLEEAILEIDYIYNANGELLGGLVLFCYGGPTISVNTRRRIIKGTWGTSKYHRPYKDGVGLDELVMDSAPY